MFEKQDANNQGKAFSGFVIGMEWVTSFEELFKRLTELCEPIDCPSTYKEHAKRIQGVLSNTHREERHPTLHWTLPSKVYEVTGLHHSEVNLETGTVAEKIKAEEYKHVRDSCGCSDCTTAKEWEHETETSRPSVRPLPCAVTQVISKLLSTKYVNMNPPFFRQCVEFSNSAGLPTDILPAASIFTATYCDKVPSEPECSHQAARPCSLNRIACSVQSPFCHRCCALQRW